MFNNNNNNNNNIKPLVYTLFCMGVNFNDSLGEEEIEDVGESEMENEIFCSSGSDKEVTGFHNDGSCLLFCTPGMRMMKKL